MSRPRQDKFSRKFAGKSQAKNAVLFQQTILRYFVHFGQHEKATRQSPAGSLCFIVLFPCYFRVLCVRFSLKLVDCLEKCLIYGHIRRFANWFYYSFTTFNGLSLDMQKAPAGCRIDRYTTLRGTSKRKNKISTTYKAAFLTPTLENRNAAFLYPHVTQ